MPTGQTTGQTIDMILHDIIAFGVVAASIFVKNPTSQQHASTIIQAVSELLPMLDSQLTGTSTVTVTPTPAPAPTVAAGV